MEMWQPPRVPGVAARTDTFACANCLTRTDENPTQGQMRIERDRSVGVLDRHQIRSASIAVARSVLRVENDAGSRSGDRSSGGHDEIVAILPETGVSEARAISLIHLPGSSHRVGKNVRRGFPGWKRSAHGRSRGRRGRRFPRARRHHCECEHHREAFHCEFGHHVERRFGAI